VKGERSGSLTRIAMEGSLIVRGDEKLTAFIELEAATRGRWLLA